MNKSIDRQILIFIYCRFLSLEITNNNSERTVRRLSAINIQKNLLLNILIHLDPP